LPPTLSSNNPTAFRYLRTGSGVTRNACVRSEWQRRFRRAGHTGTSPV
jgi:hypothetical protein